MQNKISEKVARYLYGNWRCGSEFLVKNKDGSLFFVDHGYSGRLIKTNERWEDEKYGFDENVFISAKQGSRLVSWKDETPFDIYKYLEKNGWIKNGAFVGIEKIEKPYINYDEFELVCWDADGEDTNIGIDVTKDQARQICEIIGLIGFTKNEDDEIQGVYKKTDTLSLTHINAERLEKEIYSLAANERFRKNKDVKAVLQQILCWIQEERVPSE